MPSFIALGLSVAYSKAAQTSPEAERARGGVVTIVTMNGAEGTAGDQGFEARWHRMAEGMQRLGKEKQELLRAVPTHESTLFYFVTMGFDGHYFVLAFAVPFSADTGGHPWIYGSRFLRREMFLHHPPHEHLLLMALLGCGNMATLLHTLDRSKGPSIDLWMDLLMA